MIVRIQRQLAQTTITKRAAASRVPPIQRSRPIWRHREAHLPRGITHFCPQKPHLHSHSDSHHNEKSEYDVSTWRPAILPPRIPAHSYRTSSARSSLLQADLHCISSGTWHAHRCPVRYSHLSPRSTVLPYQSARKHISETYTPPVRRMSSSTSKVEEAKALAATRAVADHFSPSFKYVGIGSGTTIVYVIEEIKRVLGDGAGSQLFVPTGYQSREAIVRAGLTPVAFDTLPEEVVLDVAFDGADEVDEELNAIKGGGACLFQEKLVAERARKFVCVADYRKLQPRLLTNWPTIPIEVAPISSQAVLWGLKVLGSTTPAVRSGPLAKAGPLKTDQDFFIIDAPFPTPLLTKADVQGGKGKGDGSDGTWEVEALGRAIKAITGVLEVGLFCGRDGVEAFGEGAVRGTAKGGQKPVAVYFGMQDGSVEVRNRKG